MQNAINELGSAIVALDEATEAHADELKQQAVGSGFPELVGGLLERFTACLEALQKAAWQGGLLDGGADALANELHKAHIRIRPAPEKLTMTRCCFERLKASGTLSAADIERHEAEFARLGLMGKGIRKKAFVGCVKTDKKRGRK